MMELSTCIFLFLLSLNPEAVSEVLQMSQLSSLLLWGIVCESGRAPRVKATHGKQQQEAEDVTQRQKNDAVAQNQAAG